MKKLLGCVLLISAILLTSCREDKPAILKAVRLPFFKTATVLHPPLLWNSDTALINHKYFVLSVYKTDSLQYFKVEKKSAGIFKTIMVDSDFITNNSDLFFKDENKDGFADIVWTKKWQDHSYLCNPQKDIFIEVGEMHDVEILKLNGKPVLYRGRYPLLYFLNEEDDMLCITELHSELFIINENYQKLSFATIDNFTSTEDRYFDTCRNSGYSHICCFVPPYFDKYGKNSIWNSGRIVDSFFLKSAKFNHGFITRYWQSHYRQLLKYGQVFHVRRDTPLKYF